MAKTELYGTAGCPCTNEMREWLIAPTGGQRTVPVLVEDGKATQIGWQGRGCIMAGRVPHA